MESYIPYAMPTEIKVYKIINKEILNKMGNKKQNPL